MSNQLTRWLAGAAVASGIAYALAPVAAWFAVAMIGLFRRAQRGLDARERVWIAGLLGTALAVRLAAIAAFIFVAAPGTYTYPSFFGDGRYAIGRSLWMRGAALGETMHPRFVFEAFEPYGASGYNYLLAALQTALGPATWSLHLVAVGCFLAGAVVWHRVVRQAFGAAAALVALALMLFAPTWLAWSVSPIKESFQFLVLGLCVLTALGALAAARGARRLASGLCCIALLGVLATLRSGGLVIIVGSLLVGAGAVLTHTRRTAAILAVGATIAVALFAATRPAVRDRVAAEINAAANRHLGHVRTPGTFYKLLDERFYHEPPGVVVDVVLTPAEAARFLMRAVAAFVAVPLPWQLQATPALVLLPMQMFWYALVALAAAGTPAAWRASPALTAIVLGYIALSIVVIAPNSGNVGTLMRHRDMLLPFVISLSAAGVGATAAWLSAAHRPLVEARA
jgi:hypothetical protein